MKSVPARSYHTERAKFICCNGDVRWQSKKNQRRNGNQSSAADICTYKTSNDSYNESQNMNEFHGFYYTKLSLTHEHLDYKNKRQ